MHGQCARGRGQAYPFAVWKFGFVLRLDWETRRFHAYKCWGSPRICMQLRWESQPQGETSFTIILLWLFGRITCLQTSRPKLVTSSNQTLWKLRICEQNTSFRDMQHPCLQHHCGAASFLLSSCCHIINSTVSNDYENDLDMLVAVSLLANLWC